MNPPEYNMNRKRKLPERDYELVTDLRLSSSPGSAIVSESLPSLPATSLAMQTTRSQTAPSLAMQRNRSQTARQIPFQVEAANPRDLSRPNMTGSSTPLPSTNVASRARRKASSNTSKKSKKTPSNTSKKTRKVRSETVPIPFPWATDRRATVRDLNYLLQREIFTITGMVQCKHCEREYEIGFDLKSKFTRIEYFIARNKSILHDRAPSIWLNPILPTCCYCHQENSVKPIMAEKKRDINWLFLLLGQMLGCCTLDQLKYFCKHTNNHRTGAKDRVLYLTYLALCKQLDPKDLFER